MRPQQPQQPDETAGQAIARETAASKNRFIHEPFQKADWKRYQSGEYSICIFFMSNKNTLRACATQGAGPSFKPSA
jgi:hypothetical protein